MRERFFLLLFLLVVLVAPTRARADGTPAFVVIVNTSNRETSASRTFVTDAFLKKTTRWPNGDVIRPVDLASDSSTRAKFSDDVLHRSVSAVKSYWQQIIFTGRDVPPPELASDADVVKFVANNPGAIGYVSGGTSLAGVKALKID